ncbi:MAG: methyltransferase domain-containing protein [Betaproteobacteria bacterium]
MKRARPPAAPRWSIEVREERGVRYLHFGSEYVQGAMRIARPFALELEYTRDLMLPLLLRGDAWPASVLQVGLGSGSVTKFLHRHRPDARITVVELVAEVVAAARQFFRLPEESGHLRIEIADAHDWLVGRRRTFDFIVLDAFDDRGNAGMLDTVPFYLNCLEHLSRSGMVSVNLLTRRRGVAASVERLRAAFGERVLLLPPSEAGNTVAIAAAGASVEATMPQLRDSARRLKAETGLDLSSALSRLATAQGETLRL